MPPVIYQKSTQSSSEVIIKINPVLNSLQTSHVNNTDLSKIAIELENLDLSKVTLGFSEFLSNNDIQAKKNAQF